METLREVGVSYMPLHALYKLVTDTPGWFMYYQLYDY